MESYYLFIVYFNHFNLVYLAETFDGTKTLKCAALLYVMPVK